MCVPLGTSIFAALLGTVVGTGDAAELAELAELGAADGDAWADVSVGGWADA